LLFVSAMTSAKGTWLRIGALLALVLGLAAAWKWTGLREWVDPERLNETFEPHRRSWYVLPLVIAIFVVAELVMFPVLVLVFVCGLAFGPWLGALYALAGAVASAVPPFFLGRRLGRRKVEHWGGAVVRRIARILDRRGVIAVFLVRKVPAPYSLVNLLCGACGLTLRDFVLGTLLGMSTGVILITFLGGRLLDVLSDPEPRQIATALALLALPVTAALLVQRYVNRLERTT
jgi:uncharacterized membrane protein YdjX (TVP38/TMEM64 family)